MEDDLIAESNSFAETDDPEILAARAAYTEAYEKHKAAISDEAEKVKQAGGLFIIGTERHESRRIDNQLRGRSGRQGDPGETRFYLSMEDDVMRLFGSERIMGMMDSLGLDEDTPIDAKILSGAIENAQKTVEGRNFQARKSTLEYDDVMNTQRNVVYGQRQKVLDGEDLKASIESMLAGVISGYVHEAVTENGLVEDPSAVLKQMEGLFFPKGAVQPETDPVKLEEALLDACHAAYAAKTKDYGEEIMREAERVFTLRVVDEFWMDHLDAMTDLRQGVGLRAYGQMNPVDVFKKEGFDMFEQMNEAIREEIIKRLFAFRLKTEEELKREQVAKIMAAGSDDGTVKKQPVQKKTKVGRNDPCPCGSGKKYKNCCLDKDLMG